MTFSEEVRHGQPVLVGEVTITPLERVKTYRFSGKAGSWVYILKEPVGVVIDSIDGQQTIDLR